MTSDLEAFLDGFTDRDWQSPSVSGTVRFALVGLGWWVRSQVLPALAESELCEPTVVVDESSETVETVATDTDTRGLTPSAFHDGEAHEEYDAVYVATPNATHLEYVRSAASHGKHVLCEKPMEINASRAEELVEACENAGVTLMIAYRMQTEPAVRRARELLDEGFVGQPVQAHGANAATLLEVIPDTDQWRLDPDVAGGCAMIDLGIYPLNTLRFLLGVDPVSVHATTRSEHEAFAAVDEHVSFSVTFEDGTQGACTASHNAYASSRLSVLGTDGRLEIDSAFHPWLDRELKIRRGGTTTEIEFEQADQMLEEFDYFADCVLNDTQPTPDGRHGLTDIETIEAVYESAETGNRVSL